MESAAPPLLLHLDQPSPLSCCTCASCLSLMGQAGIELAQTSLCPFQMKLKLGAWIKQKSSDVSHKSIIHKTHTIHKTGHSLSIVYACSKRSAIHMYVPFPPCSSSISTCTIDSTHVCLILLVLLRMSIPALLTIVVLILPGPSAASSRHHGGEWHVGGGLYNAEDVATCTSCRS